MRVRESKWKFETSKGVSGVVGVGLAAGMGHGWISLIPPGGGLVKFKYTSVGAGFGGGFEVEFPKTPLDGLSISTEAQFSAGKIYMWDGFKGSELEADDFVGGCVVLEASANVIAAGGAASAMLLGFDMSYLKYLAIGFAAGQAGADVLALMYNFQTSANVFMPMIGANAGLGVGASVIGSVGTWDISSVEASSIEEPDIPYSESVTKITSFSKDDGIVLAGDGLFLFDHADLMTAAQAQNARVPPPEGELHKAGAAIRSHPGLNVTVTGHTDDVGKDDYNLRLSLRRANTVAQWLIAKGYVMPGNIVPKGVGSSQPKELGKSEKARKANRRVVITMIK